MVEYKGFGLLNLRYSASFEQLIVAYRGKNMPIVKNLYGVYCSVRKSLKIMLNTCLRCALILGLVHALLYVNPLDEG